VSSVPPIIASPTAVAPPMDSVPADRLTRFDGLYAPLLAAWVRTEQDLTWLAPGTKAPLTAAKIASWGAERPCRYLYWRHGCDIPSAYAELNPMPNIPDQLWIGHFLVDPVCRGRGIGRRFMARLLELAFLQHACNGVLLVVFPDNPAAIRCYEQSGMMAIGNESRYFETTRSRHDFVRMAIDRAMFDECVRQGRMRPTAPVVEARARPAPQHAVAQ
jgi:RimJ/RimL family protein N-acetyltransferase